MANITTCPKCGQAYEETSEEHANDPNRECFACWRKRRPVQIVEDSTNIEPYQYASMKAAPVNW